MPNHDHAFSDNGNENGFKIEVVRTADLRPGDLLISPNEDSPSVSLILNVEDDENDDERVMVSMIVCDAGPATRGDTQALWGSFDRLDAVGRMVI